MEEKTRLLICIRIESIYSSIDRSFGGCHSVFVCIEIKFMKEFVTFIELYDLIANVSFFVP